MTVEHRDIAVGQVWEDKDPRMKRRRITITAIGSTHATVDNNGRRSRIRKDRFRPTSNGYRFIEEGTS